MPYLGLYFEMRGMNSVQIGMLNSLFYVVTIISAMTIGYFADKTRRPRLTVSICFSCVVLVVLHGVARHHAAAPGGCLCAVWVLCGILLRPGG